jgi:hypothetical protein
MVHIKDCKDVFWDLLGTLRGRECDIELIGNVHVRNHPFHNAQPKLELFGDYDHGLMDNGIITPIPFSYTGLAVFIKKQKQTEEVDCTKVNEKVIFLLLYSSYLG